VLNRTVRAAQLVVEDEVGFAADFAAGVQQEGAGVQVELGTVGGARVPAQADQDLGQAQVGFRQGEVATF
jgi:hypothetical protein